MNNTPFKGADLTEKSVRFWRPDLLAPHDEFSRDIQETLISRVRDLYRNNPLAKAIIRRLCDNVIGTGVKLRVSINNEILGISQEDSYRLENKITRLFSLWGETCDFYGVNSFNSLQYLIYLEYLITGECFINTPMLDDNLKLQVIESEYVDNPAFNPDMELLKNGIKLNKQGIPVSAFVREHHPNDYNVVPIRWHEVPFYGGLTKLKRLLQLYRQERGCLYRGIPPLATVMGHLKSLEKFTDAELAAAVIASYFAIYIKKSTPPMSPYSHTGVADDADPEKKELNLTNGMILDLDAGESIEQVNPTRPNSEFAPFYNDILNQITASFGIAPEWVKVIFGSTYSASKGASLQTWKTIMAERGLFIDQVLNHVFKLFLRVLITKGKVDLPLNDEILYAITPHWIGTGRDEIDEYKATLAADKRISMGISTLQREAEELQGEDWLGVTKQRSVETRLRQQSGLEDIHIEDTNKPVQSAQDMDKEELFERNMQ